MQKAEKEGTEGNWNARMCVYARKNILKKLNHCIYFQCYLRSSLVLDAVWYVRTHQCKSLQSIGKFNHVRTWWQYFLFFLSLSLSEGPTE